MVIIVKFLVCIMGGGGGGAPTGPLPLWQLISGNCEGKNAPNQHYWSSLFKDVIKKFSKKILLDNNVTHLMQIFFLKKKGV